MTRSADGPRTRNVSWVKARRLFQFVHRAPVFSVAETGFEPASLGL
jgi:hypothetical protein